MHPRLPLLLLASALLAAHTPLAAATLRTIAGTGYQGYVGQEFIPTHPDPLASLQQGVAICSV